MCYTVLIPNSQGNVASAGKAVSHSDGIPIQLVGNGAVESKQQLMSSIPASYYTSFLSAIAKERKPSPSA